MNIKKISRWFLLLLLLPISTSAQNGYLPLLQEGRTWRYEYRTIDWGNTTEEMAQKGDYTYNTEEYAWYVGGDTVVDGRSCKKIYYVFGDKKGAHLWACAEENERKVLVRLEDSDDVVLPAFTTRLPAGEWTLLHDFSAGVDNYVECGALPYGTWTVKDDGLASLHGVSRRCLMLANANQSMPDYEVEGIGTSHGLFYFENIINNGSATVYIGCYDGSDCLVTASDFFDIKIGVALSAQSFCYSVECNMPHWVGGTLVETSEMEWLTEISEQTYSIDGKTYVKVSSHPMPYPTTARRAAATAGDDGLRYYTLGIRRADGKVYVNHAEYLDHLSKTGFSEYEEGFLGNPDYVPYHLTGDGEMILYDYTMEVGDTYRHVEGYDDVSVVAKDFVTLNDGMEHRRLTLSNGLVLVEGLGCINSTGLLLDYLNPATDRGWISACLQWSMADDNSYIYKADGYKPPVNGIETVDTPSQPSAGQSYDLQGRRVSGPTSKGIHITDGKKTVVP